MENYNKMHQTDYTRSWEILRDKGPEVLVMTEPQNQPFMFKYKPEDRVRAMTGSKPHSIDFAKGLGI